MTSQRLRILFLASYFPKPDNPLMGTWALTQAQALARHVELQVVSFTSWVPKALARTAGAKAYAGCPDTHLWPGDVSVHYPRWLYYPVPPIKQWSYRYPQPYQQLAAQTALPQLCALIDSFQPALIFCHHALPNGWLVAQLPDRFTQPLIVQEHDFDEIADCYRYPHRQAAMQQVADRSWAMLAVSQRMATDLSGLFPQSRILTHHNGVNGRSAAGLPRPAALAAKKVVLSCALFAERKGIPLLIEAFCRIAPDHPDALLRIIGAGPDAERVEAAVAQYDRTHQVQLLGKKPHAEVLQEMDWADCFALVGWDEPFATVYLEAMAAGKPIICCDDGGINDVIQTGIHGYTVPPQDVAATAKALSRMLSQDAKRQEMGDQAQRLVQEQLTWEVKTQELVRLFEQAVAEPPANRSVNRSVNRSGNRSRRTAVV